MSLTGQPQSHSATEKKPKLLLGASVPPWFISGARQ